MSILIEAPTAAAVFDALQRQLPQTEFEALKSLFIAEKSESQNSNYSEEWSEADIEDFRRSTGHLIEKRLGAEEYDYD